MAVGIVEVMNNTGSVLHYTNQESGIKFDLNPTPQRADGGPVDISSSFYYDDTVPWKSSGKKIVIAVDGGPQFSVCDDNYRFSVVEDGKSEQWTGTFNNGDRFVMLVENNDVKFMNYTPGLRAVDPGFVIGGTSEAATTFSNANVLEVNL